MTPEGVAGGNMDPKQNEHAEHWYFDHGQGD
jgi:hypothetical protein